MECSNPNGCPTPADCDGHGCQQKSSFTCCSTTLGNPESIKCCSSTLDNPESMVAESFTFSEPLELKVNRLEAQVIELFAHLDRIEAK